MLLLSQQPQKQQHSWFNDVEAVDKIELDCEIVSIKNEENPFLDNNAEFNNKFKELPDYISDIKYSTKI